METLHRISLASPPVITAIGAAIHDSQEPREYCAAGRWRLHFYASPVTMHTAAGAFPIASGSAGLWAPDAQLDCRFTGRSMHACVHFQLPIAAGDVLVPTLQDLGARYPVLEQAFLESVRWFETTPHRAEARLWDLLWQLAKPDEALQRARHPALERARAFINSHLVNELAIEDIAVAAHCSPNHLLRLFRKELGVTTVAYIRNCRVQRAAYLLRESDIPIKEIAAEVGIPDLHFFNKVLRVALGASPRGIRSRARG